MRSQRTIPGLILTFFMVLILVYGLPAGSQNESVDTASFDHDRIRVCGSRLLDRLQSVCRTRFSKRNLQSQHDGATFGQNEETNQKRTSKSDTLRAYLTITDEKFRRSRRQILQECCINRCTEATIASYCSTL